MIQHTAKKYAGKFVKGMTIEGQPFEGRVLYACNDYCDKWTLHFDNMTEVEADSISSIQIK